MNKSSLEKALKLTVPALGNRNLIAGLDCFHFANNRVTAFNGTVALSAPVGFEFPINGALPGETFLKFLSELDQEVDFQYPDSDTLEIVYDGKSKTKFTIQHVDTAFLNDVEETASKINLPTNVLFAAGLKRCLPSIGGSKGSGEAGIYFFIENSECKMYASNGYNSSRFIFPIENFEDTQIFLPAAFCELLIFLFDSLNTEPTEVCVTDKYIRASFGEVTLRSGFYANPVNSELKTLVDDCLAEAPLVEIPPAFKSAIKRSEIIVSKNSLINISYGVDEGNNVHVTAQGGSGQKLDDVVNLAYPLDGNLNVDVHSFRKTIETCNLIGFNPNYLVLEGIEGYFNFMVSAKIGNN